MFEHNLGLRFQNILERLEASTARVQRIVVVLFQFLPFACEDNFLRIDDYHKIAEISIRRECRLVLASDDVGDP